MSETDFLKLKKHDNVETNTEKFDIENYLNGNWDKINENAKKVNTDISNINSKNKEQDTNIKQLQENTETSSNKITELEKELKEAQEDFYQNSIRGQASGEYIHVEDSSNCRAKIGIGGNSEQETRTGYNKLNMSNAKGGTSGGITCVINEDGSYQFKGTATTTDNGSVNVWFLGYYNSKAPTLFTLEAGTYYINDVLLFSGIKKLNEPLKKIYTFTSEVNITGVRAMSATPGQTYNEVKYPIIAKSNKELTWEQYGAMPSPDYLSSIVAVGSNVNLFAGGDTVTNNGVTFTKNKDDSYDIVGMAKEQANCIKFVDIQNSGIINGNIYNIHVSENLPDGVKILIEAYNDTAWIRHVLGSSLIPNVSKANIENANKIRFTLRVEKGISVNIHNLRIKLEKDTIETAYSKYGQGCVKVTKCNKNLAIKNVKGYFSMSGFKIKIDNNSESFLFYAEKGKEYTRSCKVNLDRNRIGKIDTLDVTQGMTVSNGQEINSKKFICDDSGIYIWFVNSTLNDSIKESFQIEESSTESSFEQHKEQSYIMPVQKEMLQGDYFDYDNEEEVHVWNKLILNGTENWEYDSTYNYFRCSSYVFDKIPSTASEDVVKQLSNYFSVVRDWGIFRSNTNLNGFSPISNAGYRLVIRNTNYKTVDTFKTWLKLQYDAGTPVMIYYKLQTPTRLAFTDEQKAVAKELNNARTYKNVTNITTDSKAILSLDYAKDLETQNQKMQNEIDEIKQLLSTTQTSALLLDNMQTDIESEVE